MQKGQMVGNVQLLYLVQADGEKKKTWEPALIVYSESGDWGQEFV